MECQKFEPSLNSGGLQKDGKIWKILTTSFLFISSVFFSAPYDMRKTLATMHNLSKIVKNFW